MQQSSRLVRFGFSLLAMLIVVGLIYAGKATPETELAALISTLTATAG